MVGKWAGKYGIFNLHSDLKKIVLTGPESVGKTVLAEKLAAHYNTVWVPEYAREYCDIHGNQHFTPLDFAHIAGGQLLLEDQMAEKANGLLFCDTDLITTEIWAHYFLEKCPAWIQDINKTRHYDLYLLLSPDVPWVADNLRHFEDSRGEFFELLKNLLNKRGLHFETITGHFTERFLQAVYHIDMLLERKNT